MEITFSNDKEFLKKLIHNGAYDPFSRKFNRLLNIKLLEEAKKAEAGENTISIIQCGSFLNQFFHSKLMRLLEKDVSKLNMTKKETKEFFMALVNEKELINFERQQEFLNQTKALTAFDLKNAVVIFKEEPNLPQNYTSLSEMNVDFANLFFKSLVFLEDSKGDATEEESFTVLENLWYITNLYYGIKAHYDSCLFNYGKINLIGTTQIFFDSTQSGLNLLQRISNTFIEELKIGRLYQCLHYSNTNDLKTIFMEGGSSHILSEAALVNGFVRYKIKKRVPRDFEDYLDPIVLITDMYPFFYKHPLTNLNGLTLLNLLHLHTEVKLLAFKFYKTGFHIMEEFNIKKLKNLYLPKIKHNVLKSYLLTVTAFKEKQVDIFIDLMTAKEGREFELYYTPLVKEEDYYYFPYFPLINANYLFLIDYWLEQAKENLKDRGNALEEYIKSELKSIDKTGNNRFKLIDKSKFAISGEKVEEIDLVIETKNSIIIAEIKCIKYPLNPRGYYTYFNDVILHAQGQLLRKANFLIDNKHFFQDLINFQEKKIIKTIILNYPSFTGGSVNGIPITDMTTFLSYFRTNKMTLNAFSVNSKEIIEEYIYYSDENEFCDNFNSYLLSPPNVKRMEANFTVEENSYNIDNFVKLRYMSINPISAESKFMNS